MGFYTNVPSSKDGLDLHLSANRTSFITIFVKAKEDHKLFPCNALYICAIILILYTCTDTRLPNYIVLHNIFLYILKYLFFKSIQIDNIRILFTLHVR